MSVPPGGLTLSDMRGELIQQRFGAGLQTSIDRWLNARYASVWSDQEWPFKRIHREQWDITGAMPQMPVAWAATTRLETSDGIELQFLLPDDFDDWYPVGAPIGSKPESYTVIGGQLIIGPTAGAQTLFHSYEIRVVHYNASDVKVPGVLLLDTDYPFWPEEYHYMLVVGATATGLKLQNDPTWDALEQEFTVHLEAMADDLIPPDQYGTVQYGRDQLDNY